MVLKIQTKTALEVVELHRNTDQENIYFKDWKRAHVHGPTWTMPSSDHLGALLSTAGTEHPMPTTARGWGFLLLPAHQPRVWMRNGKKLGGGVGSGGWHSAAQNSCALSFLSLCNTWESSHALPLSEGGQRWTQSSNLLPLQQQDRGIESQELQEEESWERKQQNCWERADVGHDHSLSYVRYF